MKSINQTLEYVIAAVLLVLALLIVVYAENFDSFLTDPLGPMFFPRLMGLVLGVCALWIIGRLWWRNSAHKSESQRSASEPSTAASEQEYPLSKRLPILPVVTLIYVLILPFAGFLIATALLLNFLIPLMSIKADQVSWPHYSSVLRSAMTSPVHYLLVIGICLMFWLGFSVLLQVPLP